MHWLIDGNNLMHLLPEIMWGTQPVDWPSALAALIKPYRDAKSLNLTLFFDGGERPGQTRLSGMAVVFSGPDKSADEAMLERLRNKPGLGLITNDRALASLAKQLGARLASADTFAYKLKVNHGLDDAELDAGRSLSTRKKGPARRLKKSQRQQNSVLRKL